MENRVYGGRPAPWYRIKKKEHFFLPAVWWNITQKQAEKETENHSSRRHQLSASYRHGGVWRAGGKTSKSKDKCIQKALSNESCQALYPGSPAFSRAREAKGLGQNRVVLHHSFPSANSSPSQSTFTSLIRQQWQGHALQHLVGSQQRPSICAGLVWAWRRVYRPSPWQRWCRVKVPARWLKPIKHLWKSFVISLMGWGDQACSVLSMGFSNFTIILTK